MNFNGEVKVDKAIYDYQGRSLPNLIHPGRSGPWITLGGGNEDGRFNLEANKKIFWDLHKIVDAKYSGVVFDIEETAGDVHELIKSF